MSWRDHAEQGVWALAVAAALALGAWLRSIVRKVYTNEELIRLMKAEIEHRDQLRQADREAVHEVRESVRDVKDSVQRIEDVLMNRSNK